MNWKVRDIETSDIDAVHSLNESSVPAVNSLSREKMEWFASNAAYFRVAADDNGIAGFLVGLRPGVEYDSLNYQWFSRHYQSFGYIDRVAVDPRARRTGLASQLYADFDASLPPSVPVLVCEVNIQPPNPSSMRFHERLGFRSVGRQETEGGSKEVALLEKRR